MTIANGALIDASDILAIQAQINNPTCTGLTVTGTRVNLAHLPQSSDGTPPAGCVSGDLYVNGGVLCVTP